MAAVRHPQLLSLLAAGVLLLGPGARAHAEPDGLRALVVEHTDPFTGRIGARDALETAGFTPRVLAWEVAPKVADGPLLVIGSFASEAPEYAAFAGERKEALLDYVRAGGVLLQFTQADAKEATPPFLADGLRAQRTDRDSHRLFVRAAGHPLLAGLRPGDEPDRLKLSRFGRRPAAWDCFDDSIDGFRVLVCGRADGRDPVLLEAAVGEGRLLLTSLHLDKSPTDGVAKVARERLFANLASYVRAVQDGTAPEVVPTPARVEVPLDTPGGDPVPADWDLALSDLLVFRRGAVDAKGVVGKTSLLTLHGHELRDAGQYMPADPKLDDLGAILAFRLPPAGEAQGKVDLRLRVGNVVPLRIKGEVRTSALADGVVRLDAQYTYASQGKGARSDKRQIRSGTATVVGTFDSGRGVLRHVRVRMEHQLRRLDAKRGAKPKQVVRHDDWRLDVERRARYRGFHDEVGDAIDRGVAHLRTLQKEDGHYEPHAKYAKGSSALAILTLSACGVPRDDPAIARALEQIFLGHPSKNYDRAVCLMAIDRVYTPPGEHAGALRGRHAQPVRDLPDDRRAWCRKVAEELLAGANSAGSWGYPNAGNDRRRFDMSNTQYAVLGMHAASKLGFDDLIDDSVWLGIIKHCEQLQERKAPRSSVSLVREGEAIVDESRTATRGVVGVKSAGGFRYSTIESNDQIWSSMTCAAISSLAIARHHLERRGKLSSKVGTKIDQLMLGGWSWLDAHWAVDRHPHKGGWYLYYLYSLERAAVFDRVKRVGGKDWYYEGAAQLLARQAENGGWKETGAGVMPGTCFALLFLRRATTPLTGSGR